MSDFPLDPSLAGLSSQDHDVPMPDVDAAANQPSLEEVMQKYATQYDEDEEESVSDADSDYLELEAATAKLDASIAAFREAQRAGIDASGADRVQNPGVPSTPHLSLSQPPVSTATPIPTPTPAVPVRGSSSATRPGRGGPGRARPTRKRKLGPRKAAEPTPEIKFRLGVANDYFLQRRYADARAVLEEIIRLNAETYDAWTLLGTIFDELGERENALNAMTYAAHLMPKVPNVWMNAAAYCLAGLDELEGHGGEEATDDWEGDELERLDRAQKKREIFGKARVLYGAAVRADGANVEARTCLADVLMQLGHAGSAVTQYTRVLEQKPLNIRTVRNLADGALDAKDKAKTGAKAREAYRRIVDHCMDHDTREVEEGEFEWSDLRIYLEFFAVTEEWATAAKELKEVARWLLGRREEGRIWEESGEVDDDREWDVGDERRASVLGFVAGRYPFESYGLGLPIDLRAKLCGYRLKMGQIPEAMIHMAVLDPQDRTPHEHGQEALERFRFFPDCLKDVGAELLGQDLAADALHYFDLYRSIAIEDEALFIDADFLVNQGRAYLGTGDKVAAEESFIGALDEDEYHIDARFELAKLYEAESEKEGREEAFLLVNEALDLEAQARRAELLSDRSALLGKPRRRYNRKPKDPNAPKVPRKPRQPGEKRRYRPRRLGNTEERQRQELERKNAMLEKYRMCVQMRPEAGTGDKEAIGRWMAVAKELVEDFTSSKQFFPWDKYVRLRGFAPILGGGGDDSTLQQKNSKLAAMAARLQQNLAPLEGHEINQPSFIRHDYHGIPMEDWLDLLLEYALHLAFTNQTEDAYYVLLTTRDSVVFKSREHAFLIHITWALCAVHAGDEEQCVHIARFFMRDYMPGTDSYRLFAAMVRLCQAPPSWYTSGPGQKFILRQIKIMDKSSRRPLQDGGAAGGGGGGEGEGNDTSQLDVCLLTIYGHILYTSQSYPYALSYFMRAASLDPTNPMINLSLGIGYIQYALKRQAPNRQYLLTQGFAFFRRYYDARLAAAAAADSPGARQEAMFNMGRAYHIIGLGHLALEYYRQVLDDCAAEFGANPVVARVIGREDLALEAAYNVKTICFQMGDLEGARAVTERWLVA